MCIDAGLPSRNQAAAHSASLYLGITRLYMRVPENHEALVIVYKVWPCSRFWYSIRDETSDFRHDQPCRALQYPVVPTVPTLHMYQEYSGI